MKKTVTIHGREYRPVAMRVHNFRQIYTIADGWGIHTELVHVDEQSVIFKAWISDHSDRTVATGYAEEVRTNTGINKTSALENAETSAIGRALAAAGFAGDEYASADEMVQALNRQNAAPTDEKPWLNKGSKEWEQTVKALKAGKATVSKVLEKRRLRKDDRVELEKIQAA